jgi:hypothetical protein
MARAGLLWFVGLAALVGGLAPHSATAKPAPRGEPSTVTLIRGGCMGPCAEYEVTIADDGRVKWLGLDFVSFIGDTEYSVSPRRARAIVRRAGRFDFAALATSEHLPCTTDMRKARVVVDTRRGFYDDHGCRSLPHFRARRLERAIDRVAKTKRFEADRAPPCLHAHDNIHYQGAEDVEVRAHAVDEPLALHRGEVLDANIATLRANPSFRIEVWTMGRPSDVQLRRIEAYAAALAEGGIERERITVEMLEGSGGSKLGEIADDMVRVAITSGSCKLLR